MLGTLLMPYIVSVKSRLTMSRKSHASAVAQGNVVRAMSASYGKAYIRPFAETKPLNLQPPKFTRLITLVT
jgi:hypothetical protein